MLFSFILPAGDGPFQLLHHLLRLQPLANLKAVFMYTVRRRSVFYTHSVVFSLYFIPTIIDKSVGKVAFLTCSFPSSPLPWPNDDQNVNLCARNCSVMSLH